MDALKSCEVVILTALSVEYQAVVAHLQETQEVVHPQTGTIYGVGSFAGERRTWRVAVAQVGVGGIQAAIEAEKAISYFSAQIALFVGIAGGRKDVRFGDVVVADKLYAYGAGKDGQRFEPRPELWHPSYALIQRARAEARSEACLTRLDGARHHEPFVLAASEKILASTHLAAHCRSPRLTQVVDQHS